MNTVDHEEIQRFIAEDLGSGDLTAAIIPAHKQAQAEVISREDMLLCGQAWFDAVFHFFSSTTRIQWHYPEGSPVPAGATLCSVAGPARAVLSGERTALNLLQTLSATASVAQHYAAAVAGTGCKVLDTRKTIPGLRLAQKYAVRCGGCYNHRIGLFDAVLIKENHILAAGSITQAITQARQLTQALVEVEVETIAQLHEALAAKPDRIMLDNFSIADLQHAVALTAKQVELEASGNIRLETIRAFAETGVDYISIGALTKHIQAIDLSMRIHLVS